MKNYLEQIGNGIIVAFAAIGIFLFLLTAVESISKGDIPMAIVWLSLSLLLIVYVAKKIFPKKSTVLQQKKKKQ